MKFLFLLAFAFATTSTHAQTAPTMKLNAGIITEKQTETKDFYTTVLGFGVTFENEFYILMHTPNREAEISFFYYPTIQANNRSFSKHFNTKVFT